MVLLLNQIKSSKYLSNSLMPEESLISTINKKSLETIKISKSPTYIRINDTKLISTPLGLLKKEVGLKFVQEKGSSVTIPLFVPEHGFITHLLTAHKIKFTHLQNFIFDDLEDIEKEYFYQTRANLLGLLYNLS